MKPGGTDVLVVAEARAGRLSSATAEILGLAASLEGRVTAVLVGDGAAAGELVARGAETVYVAEVSAVSGYDGEVWTSAVARAVEVARPGLVVAPHGSAGADLAPRLALRVGSAAVLDCLGVRVGAERVLATRPCYGGNLLTEVAFRTRPAIVTLRARSFEPAQPDEARRGEIVSLASERGAREARMRVVSETRSEPGGPALEDARVVVAGGRGLDGPDGFRMLETLAAILGGAVGASRAACDLGWYPHTHQIGLTGRSIAPDLYIAVGISGASQHMAGCAGARTIVALNKDPDAAIFKEARFGVVGDWREVLPPLIEELGGSSDRSQEGIAERVEAAGSPGGRR